MNKLALGYVIGLLITVLYGLVQIRRGFRSQMSDDRTGRTFDTTYMVMIVNALIWPFYWVTYLVVAIKGTRVVGSAIERAGGTYQETGPTDTKDPSRSEP